MEIKLIEVLKVDTADTAALMYAVNNDQAAFVISVNCMQRINRYRDAGLISFEESNILKNYLVLSARKLKAEETK